jgi:Flp pilus assembly protein TadG
MRRQARVGAHAIEFALTIPLFVVLVAAIFEFGWMFFMRSTVIHAVRDGCRAGAVIPPDEVPSPAEVAQARMTDFLGGYSIDCRGAEERCGISVTTSGVSPYETMDCTLDIAYEPIIGLVPHPDRLSARSVIMFEIQQ